MSVKHGDLVISRIGACAYDQTTHTLISLMENFTIDTLLPMYLLLIDAVSLTYELIPVPIFREKGWSDISALRFIPHKL